MKKLASCGLVVLISLLALAFPARADSAAQFALKVDRKVLFSDEQFTATATSKIDCDWILEWNGERKHADTRRLSATFTAPTVTRVTKIPLKGRCFYAPPAQPKPGRAAAVRGGASQRIQVTVPPSWTRTIVITVLPAGSAVNPPDDGGSELPDTGGPDRWLLIVGLGAVLAGAVTVREAARRRVG